MKPRITTRIAYLAAGVLIGALTFGSVVAGSAATTHGGVPGALGAMTHPDFTTPPPPQEPTLQSVDTKTTTRLYGTTPYEEAVAVTQHLWPAARPQNAPGETNNVPDRPWGIVLVTANDPLTAMSAVQLVHFPDDAPILYVTRNGIPKVTLDEIRRLGDTGIVRDHNVDVIAVGAAANPGVLGQLSALGLTHDTITAPDVYTLADKIDAYYGHLQNPDTGVPTMETSASTGGNGVMDVMIAATSAYQFALPATHWISHMPTPLLWVTPTAIPQPTIDALKRRMGHAMIYVWGGPQQVSPAVVRQLGQYGAVTRITNDDAVAFNRPPTDTPIDTSIAFAKMWDPMGMVGWNITGPGHGFTLANINDWPGIVASAPLSHIGFHAPLLLTDSATTLPAPVDNYLSMVAPTFLNTPAQGPYNMTYIIGDYSRVSWPEQAHVDYISEMSNRRVWNQNTGSTYNNSLSQ